VREYEFLTETSVTVISERRRRGPYGVLGGEPGRPGRNTLVRDGVETALPGKVELRVSAGDRLRIETPGGGGYGKARQGESGKSEVRKISTKADSASQRGVDP
jgi:N-methylhydantoinase B/oxoprolinase/acetone carboxylase alpha subunit